MNEEIYKELGILAELMEGADEKEYEEYKEEYKRLKKLLKNT